MYSDRLVWQGIRGFMDKWVWSPQDLVFRISYSENRIRRGINGEDEQLPSDFLHDCVDVFGLTSRRARYEETSDILTDDECRALLTEPLRRASRQMRFWDQL